MATIYVAYPSGIIETKEAIKETPKQYLIKSESPYRSKPVRLNKDSFYYKIFPTLPEAQAWCVERMQERVRRLEIDLDKLRNAIAKMQAELGQAQKHEAIDREVMQRDFEREIYRRIDAEDRQENE